MRLYLEALEIPPEGASMDYMPEFVKVDVTDKDWKSELERLKASLSQNKKYIIRLHYCYHGETPVRPCSIEILETIG